MPHRTPARTVSTRLPVVFAAILLGAGATHFARPAVYDRIVPKQLPGTARAWVLASGVGELVTGALVAVPRTRRVGGALAAALFVAVFPANIRMTRSAFRSGRTTTAYRVGTVLRLPLQIPLVAGALSIAREAPRG